jgi:hypothetical protein
MPPPPPSTVLSAWEQWAPGAQRARAAALRVGEQAGQYGLHNDLKIVFLSTNSPLPHRVT